MIALKPFFASLVFFMVLDFIWLGWIVKDFNLRHLEKIGRVSPNGDFQLGLLPAAATYILMALCVTYFVLPKFDSNTPDWTVLFWGGVMGLIVYGVFDFTNLAILKNYPIPFVIADVGWGITVFAIVSWLTKKMVS